MAYELECFYTSEARQDLNDILEYISYHLEAPGTAKRLVRQVADEIARLEFMPLRYRLYDDEPWHSQGVRFFSVKNYLVFYYPVEERCAVYVMRVIYGGSDVSKQLNEIIEF